MGQDKEHVIPRLRHWYWWQLQGVIDQIWHCQEEWKCIYTLDLSGSATFDILGTRYVLAEKIYKWLENNMFMRNKELGLIHRIFLPMFVSHFFPWGFHTTPGTFESLEIIATLKSIIISKRNIYHQKYICPKIIAGFSASFQILQFLKRQACPGPPSPTV